MNRIVRIFFVTFVLFAGSTRIVCANVDSSVTNSVSIAEVSGTADSLKLNIPDSLLVNDTSRSQVTWLNYGPLAGPIIASLFFVFTLVRKKKRLDVQQTEQARRRVDNEPDMATGDTR